jgi:conjugal transfer pilus assembly protein TraE
MTQEHLVSQIRALRRALIGASCLLGIALVAVGSMALALSSKRQEIVLVPTLPSEMNLGTGATQPEYMELLTRDTAALFLNRHPNNTEYFEETLLRLVHPSAYPEISTEIERDRAERIQTQTSTVFLPLEVYVEPSGNYSEIIGRYQTYVGNEMISQDTKVFAMRWQARGLSVRLVDFAEIEVRERRGGN